MARAKKPAPKPPARPAPKAAKAPKDDAPKPEKWPVARVAKLLLLAEYPGSPQVRPASVAALVTAKLAQVGELAQIRRGWSGRAAALTAAGRDYLARISAALVEPGDKDRLAQKAEAARVLAIIEDKAVAGTRGVF